MRHINRPLPHALSAFRIWEAGAVAGLAAAATFVVNAIDRTTAEILVPGRLAAPLTITPTSSTGGTLPPVVIPAGDDQTATLTYANTNGQTITFVNDGGLTNALPHECVQVFVDPRGTDGNGTAGTGLSAASPVVKIPTTPTANTTYGLAETPTGEYWEHRCTAHETLDDATIANANVRFTTYSKERDGHTRTATITAGTRFDALAGISRAAATDADFNGLAGSSTNIYKLTGFAAAQEVFYSAAIRDKWVVPTRCAPNAADTAVSRLGYSGGVLEFLPGIPGADYVPTASINTGGVTTTHRVSFNTATRAMRIKVPNFWASAAQYGTLVGHYIFYRGGFNFNFLAQITSYDAVNGWVDFTYPSGATPVTANDTHYWCLIGHPLGFSSTRQYAWSADQRTMFIRSDADNLATIDAKLLQYCNKPNVLYATGTGLHLNRYGRIVLANTGCDDARTTRIGGMFVRGSNSKIGTLVGRNVASWTSAYNGSLLEVNLTGSTLTGIEVAGIETIGPVYPYALRHGGGTGVGMNVSRADVKRALRTGGTGTEACIFENLSLAPMLEAHQNQLGFQDTAQNRTFRKSVVGGCQNVITTATNLASASPVIAWTADRMFALATTNVADANSPTTYQLRFFNGLYNSVMDRMVAIGSTTRFGSASGGYDHELSGFVAKRCILQDTDLYSVVTNTPAPRFERCLFLRSPSYSAGPSIITRLTSQGATVTNCVEVAGTWTGGLTSAMHQELTRNAGYTGYEAVDMFPDQYNLDPIPAWSAGYTNGALQSIYPQFRHVEAGMPSGLHIGNLLNANPQTSLALAAGQGDNNKLSLWNGYAVRLATDMPQQDNLSIVVAITDHTNGNAVTTQTLTVPVMA